MKPKHKVLSMRVDTAAKITKDWQGSFVQPVWFKVADQEGEFPYEVTSRKKKDLPRSLENMQKRVDGYAGGVEVEIEEGRISSMSYMLY